MILVGVVVFTLVGVCAAVVCVKRATLGGRMERSFEVLKVRPRFAAQSSPWPAVVGTAVPSPDPNLNLERAGKVAPVESNRTLPQAS
jgi:hypothetical protein